MSRAEPATSRASWWATSILSSPTYNGTHDPHSKGAEFSASNIYVWRNTDKRGSVGGVSWKSSAGCLAGKLWARTLFYSGSYNGRTPFAAFSGNERPWAWHMYCKEITEIGQYHIRGLCWHSLTNFTDYRKNHPTDCKKNIWQVIEEAGSSLGMVCKNVKFTSETGKH